jgi:PhnB protein
MIGYGSRVAGSGGEFRTAVMPMLSVRGAPAAIEFYKRAFGATELNRLTAPDGGVVAELAVEGARFYLTDESPDHQNFSPDSLGGSTVRIERFVEDPDAVAAQAVAAGGTEVIPVADQPYGLRQGRVRDPFGHHWLIGRPLDGSDWGRPAGG